MPFLKTRDLIELAEHRGRANALAEENVRLAKLLEEQTAETRKITAMLAKLRKEGYVVLDTADAWPGGKYTFSELDEDGRGGPYPLADGPSREPEIDVETQAELASLRDTFFGG